MIENGIEAADSAQAAQIKDLDQQIADKKARLAEQNRLLRSAQLRFSAYSSVNRRANDQQQRRTELWAKIVEQPHHTYFDSGQLPDGSIVDLVLDIDDHSRTKFVSGRDDRMNVMNVMNVMNMWKSATFMPQARESKGRLNVMNVVRKYFARGARILPNSY